MVVPQVGVSMSNLHVKYLLVGGGLAASTAARAIREVDAEGSILLVAQERIRPHYRAPLSKTYLRREVARQTLFISEADWFEKSQVELRTGRRASRLDVARQTVTLDNGDEISYDRLLIATGGTPKHLDIPGAQLPGLYYVRTLEDVDTLHHALDKARREGRSHARGRGRAVIIGGGILGMELSASLTQMGLAVDLLAENAGLWEAAVSETTGRFLASYLEKHGVTVHLKQPAIRLEGDGRVQRVALAGGGVIDCDLALAAVGMTINKDLLRNTPINVSRAILVDEHCRTSDPAVFAAGDCCAIRDPLFGKYRLLDHVSGAIYTGQLAGRNMAGVTEAYSGAGHYESRVFDLTLRVCGENRVVDRRLIRGVPSLDAPNFAEIGIAADGRIAQVVTLGEISDQASFAELVSTRFDANGRENELRDAETPLRSMISGKR